MSLEQLNRSYRRLARDGCIDTAGQLRSEIYNVNSRWDDLNCRTHAVVRRLRHMISISDDFEATREGLMIWLKDLSQRLANVEERAQHGESPDDAILVRMTRSHVLMRHYLRFQGCIYVSPPPPNGGYI